jgi:diguanylate cyclase (GGDEF)-like protein
MSKKGDFSFTIKSKGFIAGTLKAFQANLNHITWIAQQVADGDYDNKMDFMGDFSSAFNSMTEQLATRKALDEAKLEIMNVEKNEYYNRALHDPLTGLKNRAYFDDQIVKEIATAKRNNSLLAIVVVDLDKFKSVNDTLGHQAGDALLIEVARRLKDGTREIDTVARIGGDEFGMLWPNYTSSISSFTRLRDRLISQINTPFELAGFEYKIAISMGISVYPRDGEDIQTLIKVADNAMYLAKKEKGTYCIFPSSDSIKNNFH